MGLLCFPKASRKLQRTLKNMRVSLLCFLLTFLVLRNTIGAGKFGTPAQDFEEIRLHLHNVGLHRRHLRVLAQAVEEEKPSLQADMQRNAVYVESVDEDGGLRGGKVNGKASLWENDKQRSAILSSIKEMQGNAALLTLNVKRRNAPALPSAKDIPASLLAVTKKLEGLRLSNWDGQRKPGRAPAHGESKVVMVAGSQSSSCKNSLGEHLRLKSLKNKVHYSTLRGFEVTTSPGGPDSQSSKLFLLQSTMEKYPHAEWLWWVPNEALFITDLAFELPLQNYSDFNIVLLGSLGATYHHNDLIINLITDTFLIRNCQWSLEVVRNSAKINSMGGIGTDILAINRMVSKADLGAVGTSSLYNIVLNQEGRTLREKVYVEDAAVLRGNPNDLALKIGKILRDPLTGLGDRRLPFITHFLGCKLCHEVGNEEDGTCLKEMERLLLIVEEQAVLQRKGLDSSKLRVM